MKDEIVCLEPFDWRYSAAIVGLRKYLEWLGVDEEPNLIITEDTLEYNKKYLDKEDFLKFAEYYFKDDMHHIEIENKLKEKNPTEDQINIVNEKMKANTILKNKFKKIKFYKTILLTAYSEMGKGATWYAALAKRVLIPICKHLNTEKLCNKLNAISKEYPIDKSPYVGGFLWGYGPQEKMPKEFLEPVEVEFEGHMFPAPKCWDFYLTQLYGDYMQLPPENKRISHDFNVYMKENKE